MLKRRVSKKRFNRKFNKRKTRSLRRRTSRKRTLRRRIRGGSVAQRCEMRKPKAGAPGGIIRCKAPKHQDKKYCGKHACPQCDNVKSSIRVKCDTCCLKQCEIAGSSADINAPACAAGGAGGGAAEPCGIIEFNECAICYERNADHAIIPCGHMICNDCGIQVQECPWCKRNVEKLVKLYIP